MEHAAEWVAAAAAVMLVFGAIWKYTVVQEHRMTRLEDAVARLAEHVDVLIQVTPKRRTDAPRAE